MTAQHDPTLMLGEVLERCAPQDSSGWLELRYHKKRTRALAVEKGRVDALNSAEYSGVGVRVLEGGSMGFASTDRIERDAIEDAVQGARRLARASAAARAERAAPPPACARLARGRFEVPGHAELVARPIEETLALALRLEQSARSASPRIRSASCTYAEIFDEKAIVTSDGARAWTLLARPEFKVGAVAEKDGEFQRYTALRGGTGAFECMFREAPAEELAARAAERAVDLLVAGYPEGGRKRVLLSPQLVGILTHEAVGHTVEADFVLAGSCAAGMLGERVASELVTLCDSGASEYAPGAGGTLPVDDEGVHTQRTTIIDRGVLVSYLHDRESAARFGVEPTGNARAFEYDDEPLIRMRNTFIAPGTSSFEELLANIDDGYLFDGARNGQADANGEFMFGTAEARRIVGGRLGPLLRGVNISGRAFDVLRSVDGVGRDFRWDLGAGHCGKGQLAKVDAGGPWLSCAVLVGGRAR